MRLFLICSSYLIRCPAGPNCYVNASRSQVIPAGEPVWVDSCTKCRCHDGQDAGYWEGNRLATCSRLKNCTPEETTLQRNWPARHKLSTQRAEKEREHNTNYFSLNREKEQIENQTRFEAQFKI